MAPTERFPMGDAGTEDVVDLTAHRAADPAVAGLELRDEVTALRRVREGEARRLESRIAELEQLIPELWRRGREIETLTEALEGERRARSVAEDDAEALRTEAADLRRALAAERERHARLSGSDESVPADPYRVWDRRFRERSQRREEAEAARLQEHIDHQRRVLEEKEARIAHLAALLGDLEPEPEGPDDLTRISGIGPAIAGILHDEGYTSFEQLADLDGGEIDRLGALMPVYPGRIRDDDWIGQARRLAAERAQRRRLRGGGG